MRALTGALLAHARLSALAAVLPVAFASTTRPAVDVGAGRPMRALTGTRLAHARLSALAAVLPVAFASTTRPAVDAGAGTIAV
jgi:hypothetical protein